MKISREIAEASRVLSNELPSKFVSTKDTDTLIQIAKKIQRLQTRRAKLRKELRAVDQDIRLERRHLKALAQAIGKGA